MKVKKGTPDGGLVQNSVYTGNRCLNRKQSRFDRCLYVFLGRHRHAVYGYKSAPCRGTGGLIKGGVRFTPHRPDLKIR